MKSFGRPSRSNGAQLLQIHARAQLHGCIYGVFPVTLVALVRLCSFHAVLGSFVCFVGWLFFSCLSYFFLGIQVLHHVNSCHVTPRSMSDFSTILDVS